MLAIGCTSEILAPKGIKTVKRKKLEIFFFQTVKYQFIEIKNNQDPKQKLADLQGGR